jgi:rhodanese-related sulfurtransferase
MIKSRIRIALLIAALILIAVPSLAQNELANELEFSPYIIMPETLLYKLKAKDTDFVVYDIRTSERFKESHIKGALNYPWGKWETLDVERDMPKNRIVVLISEDGLDSFSALRYLLERGYSEVLVVEGGMQNWMYRDWIVAED